MLSLPAKLAVSDFILVHMKPTRDLAMALFDVFSADFENMRFWLRGEKIKSVQEIMDGIERAYDSDNMYMFEMFQNDKLVGDIGFANIIEKDKNVFVDYWLAPMVRRQKLIDKFLPIMESLAFENLNMDKVTLGIDVENTASRKVAERNGYVLKGVSKSGKVWVDGSKHDECEYVKQKSEWLKGKRNA